MAIDVMPGVMSEPVVVVSPRIAPISLRQRIHHLLTRLYPHGRCPERRSESRFPFPYLVRLTPVRADGRTPLAPSVTVVGKHISEHGLGFYHPTPLPYRRVQAEILGGDDATNLCVLMDLTWCRFNREGWYDGGGRFLEMVAITRPERVEAPE
jgi:hypothetical protein